MSEEPKKEFKQEYLEEKLQAISEKLGDAYGEPFLRELISRMERTVAHFNEEVDVMVATVKNNSKKRVYSSLSFFLGPNRTIGYVVFNYSTYITLQYGTVLLE